MTNEGEQGLIELSVDVPSELFQSLDVAPVRRRRLAPDVADYIVECANELPDAAALRIVVRLPAEHIAAGHADDLGPAIQHFFGVQAELERRRRRELFRSGRHELAISIAVLLVCLSISWLMERSGYESGFSRILRESLVIIGWVIVWKPAELFFYEWLPIRAQRKLYDRLARAQATVEPRRDDD